MKVNSGKQNFYNTSQMILLKAAVLKTIDIMILIYSLEDMLGNLVLVCVPVTQVFVCLFHICLSVSTYMLIYVSYYIFKRRFSIFFSVCNINFFWEEVPPVVGDTL